MRFRRGTVIEGLVIVSCEAADQRLPLYIQIAREQTPLFSQHSALLIRRDCLLRPSGWHLGREEERIHGIYACVARNASQQVRFCGGSGRLRLSLGRAEEAVILWGKISCWLVLVDC